jgi:hypothetical protein
VTAISTLAFKRSMRLIGLVDVMDLACGAGGKLNCRAVPVLIREMATPLKEELSARKPSGQKSRDVCNLTDPWQKCSFSKPNIIVVAPRITTQAAAVSLCDEFVRAVRGMRKIGQPMEPGWTLHVHSSKGELASCYLP